MQDETFESKVHSYPTKSLFTKHKISCAMCMLRCYRYSTHLAKLFTSHIKHGDAYSERRVGRDIHEFMRATAVGPLPIQGGRQSVVYCLIIVNWK